MAGTQSPPFRGYKGSIKREEGVDRGGTKIDETHPSDGAHSYPVGQIGSSSFAEASFLKIRNLSLFHLNLKTEVRSDPQGKLRA